MSPAYANNRAVVDYFKTSLNWILDLIFPIRCIGCGKFGNGNPAGWLCRSCRATINISSTSTCIGCGQPAPRGETCRLCSGNEAVDRIFAPGNYSDPLLRKLITTLKYKFVPALTEHCFVLIERHLKNMNREKGVNIFENNPIVVPVPLHNYRLNWRGFNQAKLIAEKISRAHQLILADILERVRQTSPQANIDLSNERKTNIQNAFNCIDPSIVSGRDVILIDDVCTSGATLNACAEVLKSAGSKRVTALVVARG